MHAAFLFYAFLYSRFNYYNCPHWSKLKIDSEATISENKIETKPKEILLSVHN